MFDGLQEGIIVVDEMSTIGFMNELANKVLSELAGLKNFFRNKELSGEFATKSQLDLNLFYLFENDKSEGNTKISKRKKIGSQSDHSKHSTDQSNIKTEFCIRDIIHMQTRDLSSKIFTFDQRLATQDLTKMVSQGKNIDVIVKNLPSMKNIDEEYIPKFKFIQIKKSYIKAYDGKQDRVMLCFIDISQKILYDTSKAEGEFLSLINSTISHEMRNPLNSIINQCKIIFVICQQF